MNVEKEIHESCRREDAAVALGESLSAQLGSPGKNPE